jgi:hypothetical protein
VSDSRAGSDGRLEIEETLMSRQSQNLRRAAVAVLLVTGGTPSLAQRPPAVRAPAVEGEWRYWGGDAGSTRYSPIDQIRRENVNDLQVIWRWRATNFGPTPETYYRATPLYANGVLYTVAGERRAVAAIDPATGETLWTWRMDEGLRWEKGPRRFSGRGLTYWTDGREERLIVVTPGYYMVALNARTGRPVPGFGEQGTVDLMKGLGYTLVPWEGDPGPISNSGDNGPRRASVGSAVTQSARAPSGRSPQSAARSPQPAARSPQPAASLPTYRRSNLSFRHNAHSPDSHPGSRAGAYNCLWLRSQANGRPNDGAAGRSEDRLGGRIGRIGGRPGWCRDGRDAG